jgi:hypothetical protein
MDQATVQFGESSRRMAESRRSGSRPEVLDKLPAQTIKRDYARVADDRYDRS